jgi:nucleoside-diphosphate-sugar epimerase
MLKAWVTGSSGFVGSELAALLPQRDFHVTRVTNSKSPHKGAVYVDYESRESVRSTLDSEGIPDVLFHLGWGKVYEPQSPAHLNQNFLNTKNLMDVLYENGLGKFILVGSSSEYGSREGCLTEDDSPIGRLTNYAQGKIKACHYGFEVAKKYNKVFVHVRLFHTLGAGNRETSLINQLFKNACDSKVMNLSPCDQFRDYIYLSDVAEGMIKASTFDSSEIINLGSGKNIQLKDLVKMFWEK